MITNNYFCTLDIETSTIYEDEEKTKPKFVWLSFGYFNLYTRKGERLQANYFREWEQLKDILTDISIKFIRTKILCYVHNLGFEFDFLIKNISKPDKILSNSTHKIIMATLIDFPQIEFRCSYLLTGYPLRKIGEMVKLPKMESDYEIIYPSSPVPIQYREYCIRDNDIVAKYIVDVMLTQYKMLSRIPFTKTGRVRYTLKGHYAETENKPDWDLMPDEDSYTAMERTFAGGLCITNPLFSNIIVKNVKCVDETSAYPYVMLNEQYPYSIHRYTNSLDKSIVKNKFWIAQIKFKNIRTKYTWGWLSISKMQHRIQADEVYFNGKLLYSPEIVRYICNIDFECINATYDYDDYEILDFFIMDKWGKLPECYIETIEQYGTLKGELKNKLKLDEDNIDIQRDYMLSKNDFNGIYGMTVQKLVHQDYVIDEEFNWHIKEPKYTQEDKHLKRNFLFGLYVTAYARRNLLRGILKNCPYTFIYADTDSIKYVSNTDEFIDTNNRLIDYTENPYFKNLGKFDKEETYLKFKTLGAKKYAFTYDNEKYKMVVAGLPKTAIPVKSLEEFTKGREFKSCKLGCKYVYKNTTYEYDELDMINCTTDDEIALFNKEHNIKSNGGVMLYAASYLLDITYNDEKIISDYHNNLETHRNNILFYTGIDIYNYLEV